MGEGREAIEATSESWFTGKMTMKTKGDDVITTITINDKFTLP